jgi:dipeptidyl aminopeptidase/acylaminoacyl peptidase
MSGLTFNNYLSVRSAYAPRFDPSGKRVTFLTDMTGVPQVWAVDVAGGWPHQLTFFDERVTAAEWSPKGGRLLFTMDQGGDEHHQLYVLDAEGGGVTALTDDPDVMNTFGAWSPDGTAVAYASNRRDYAFFDIYVQDVPDGQSRLVYRQDGMNSALAWSPDRRYLVLGHVEAHTYSDLLLLDLQTQNVRPLTPAGDQSSYDRVEWDSDGSGLYMSTNREREFRGLVRLDVASGEIAWLAQPPWDVEGMALSPDGKRIAYVVNEGGYSKPRLRDVVTGTDIPLDGLMARSGTLQNPRGATTVAWSPDGGSLALTVNGAVAAPDVWLYDVDGGDARQLTFSDTGGVPPDSFVEPQLIDFPTFDDRDIPAFLYTPKPAKADGRNPVVLHVHGGPEGQERPVFNPIYQYLVHRGYCVLAPNVRGSQGYGRAYSHLDDVRKRMDSVRDLKLAWQWLVDSGWGDRDRIAVMGPSYGGFMTLSAITTYPELWAAGVDLYGISDFRTMLSNTSSYRRKHRAAEYGDPEADAGFLAEIAPINHVDRIRAPLMVLHGDTDPRVPMSETEQMVIAVREQGGEVEYVRFEGEGHGFVKRANRLRAYTAIGDFLDRHLSAG